MKMEKSIAVFTIFTFLLFTLSTARIALDPFNTNSSPESVVEETTVTDSDSSPESVKTQQTFDVRFHPINRHFFDKTTRIPLRFVRRHPCRKFLKSSMIPQIKRSYGNDMILSDNTYSFDPKAIGDQVPTKWLEFKRNYGHLRLHHHLHHEHHHDTDGEFVPKFMFNREKMHHHHQEKKQHKHGFMRSIRKFLKHVFD